MKIHTRIVTRLLRLTYCKETTVFQEVKKMNEKRTSVERVMAASTGLKRTMKTKAAIMVGVAD